jgi:enamine deaminase RidA (YjgF/YER057c/UK114 family)
MMKVEEKGSRKLVSTGRKWEAIVGYSRAVRAGNCIAVTGTLGMDQDGNFPVSVAEQTRLALETIEEALHALGASLEHVIRTRLYVKDISQWKEIGKAHAEKFAEIRPATTMVQISEFADPKGLVEIEADAWID